MKILKKIIHNSLFYYIIDLFTKLDEFIIQEFAPKPLKFFGSFSLILGVVSIVLFIPVFLEFLKTGLVPRFPTLIVSVVMMLAAFLSFVCGLILDTNAKNVRKSFEVQMNIIKILLIKNLK